MKHLDLKALESKFNQLTLRERVISFAAVLICCLAIVYFWRIEPAMLANEKAQKKIRESYNQQSSIQQEINQVELKLRQDPLTAINNDIKGLQQTLGSLDQQLTERLVKFIHANKMPIVLTKVLTKHPGIKVNYLKSLPVQSYETQPAQTSKQQSMKFYRHSIEIGLTGNYRDIYQYLYNLEKLQDKFYWHSLKYEVTQYPLANVVLVIYTLSDEQDLVSG